MEETFGWVLQTSIAAGEQLNIGGQLDDPAGGWRKKKSSSNRKKSLFKAERKEQVKETETMWTFYKDGLTESNMGGTCLLTMFSNKE